MAPERTPLRRIHRRATHRNKAINRLGAAAVEFALIAPLMIMLTVGLMELGRMVMVKQVLVNASREGARRAVLPNADSATVISAVRSELQSATVNTADIIVTPSVLATAAAGTPVTVTVSVQANNVSWIPNPMFTLNSTMQVSTTMRKESL